ncbi:MAG: 7TM diverse intracellular signaling domain-containing protein [Saprospiraceae bacterium]|nr:7TM diverse intracellular signaling domain-containing protein [Saprospiraceae bacterium]
MSLKLGAQILVFILYSVHLFASDPIAVVSDYRKIHVSEMEQFLDSSSQLKYDDFIIRRELFHKPDYYLQGTRARRFTYWLKFSLDLSNSPKNLYLTCTDNRIDHLELWMDGVLKTKTPVGTNHAFNNREVSYRKPTFRLPQEGIVEIVVKIRSTHSSFFSFEVKTEYQFLKASYVEAGLFGAAYGVIILALFFSLVMRLRFSESIYLTYSVFAFTSLLVFLYIDGGGFQYFWGESPRVNFYLLLLLPVALILATGALVLSVIEAWDTNNRYFRIISVSVFVSFLGYGFVVFVPELFIHNFFYLFPFLMMIYCCVDTYRNGNKSVFAFIIGFAFVILSNLTYTLLPFLTASYANHIIQFAPHIGVVALTLSLTYSQFRKIFYLNESRKSERKRSIAQLEQLNSIKDRVNEEIAEKVAQQTEELERKNSIIHLQNAELLAANDKLKEQTDEIVNLNLQLNQENQELKSDVEKINELRIMQNTIPFYDFKKYFDSDEVCYTLLEELKWRDGFNCIKCDNSKYGNGKGEKARRCTKCGTNESVTSNTIFHRIHFPILKGFYILFLVNKHGESLVSKDLSEIVDLRLATCWKFSKKIKAKKAELEQSGKLVESWIDLI